MPCSREGRLQVASSSAEIDGLISRVNKRWMSRLKGPFFCHSLRHSVIIFDLEGSLSP